MLSQKKLLPINQLQPGMVSSMDINFEGKVLLAKGVAITEQIIEKLKKTYIFDKVEVFIEDSSNKPLIIKTNPVEDTEATFNEFSLNLKNIFDKLTDSKVPSIVDIRIFTQKIQEEFNAIGPVLKDIIFYGNGDNSIYRHSVNVAAISFILGKWLNLSPMDLNLLCYSAVLHDFGKMQILNSIFVNKNNFTPEEYEVYKTHPVIGYHFIKKIPYISPSVGEAVLLHHEKMDGSGFPLQLKQDRIPNFAKIIAIADTFDELSSNRYKQKIKGPLESLKVIQEESLIKLDCKYCNVFLNHIINHYIGETVLLNDERICKVIQIEINNLTKPLLFNDNEFLDLKKEKDLYVKKLLI